MKKLTTITLILALSVFASSAFAQVRVSKPVSASEARFFSMLSQSQSYFESGKYDQALEFAAEAYKIKSTKEVAMNMAMLHVLLGDGIKATKVVELANIVEPNVIATLLIKLVDGRDLRGAKVLVDYAANLEDNGDIAFAAGYFYDTINEVPTAKEYYLKSMALAPMMPEVNFNYARLAEVEGRYEDAVKYYEAAAIYSIPGSKINIISETRVDEINSAMSGSLYKTITK